MNTVNSVKKKFARESKYSNSVSFRNAFSYMNLLRNINQAFITLMTAFKCYFNLWYKYSKHYLFKQVKINKSIRMSNSGTTNNTQDDRNNQANNEIAMWKEFTEKVANNQSFSNCKYLLIM